MLHRATERESGTAGPGSSQFALQLHTAFLCIYSFSVLVGREQPCLINLPFTSWCWPYSFEHERNYNPVGFFLILLIYSSFVFLLSSLCPWSAFTLVCYLIDCIVTKGSTIGIAKPSDCIRLKISCSPCSLNLVWLSPAYSLENLQHSITSHKDIICCFLTKQRKLHCWQEEGNDVCDASCLLATNNWAFDLFWVFFKVLSWELCFPLLQFYFFFVWSLASSNPKPVSLI